MSKRKTTQKKSKRKISFSSILGSDRTMLIISFVISFFMWTALSANGGEALNYPVTEVPVTMELSSEANDDNLSVISINDMPPEEFKTTVKVNGNSVTVGSLTASDIQVYGTNLGTISTSGTYSVKLMARQLGIKNNYDIVSIEPSEVSIVIDRSVSKEFTIDTSQITATSPPEYYIGSPALSVNTVTIKGPEKIISKVAKAAVTIDSIEGELVKTTEFTGKIVLLDYEGNEINDEAIVIDPVDVNVTITVMMKKTVPIEMTYENEPANFDPNGFITIEPTEIEIAAPDDIIDTIDSINIGTLDFSELSINSPALKFDLIMPTGVKNINNTESVKLNFDFTNFNTKSFVISDFNYINVPEGLSAEYSTYRSIIVRVNGRKVDVARIKPSDVTATIDLTDVKAGTVNLPVSVKINNDFSCWIYGKYDVNVTVIENTMPAVTSSRLEDTDTDMDSPET